MCTALLGPRRPATWDADASGSEDGRAEYIDGSVVISPSPTREHQVACSRLIRALEDRRPDGYEVVGGWARKPDRNEFIPDVMVHPVTTESVRFTGAPALVVEVLSTNRGDDLAVKLNRYAQARLPHYWILDPANRALLAYALVGEVYDLAGVVDEHVGRDVDYGVSSARVEVTSLLG